MALLEFMEAVETAVGDKYVGYRESYFTWEALWLLRKAPRTVLDYTIDACPLSLVLRLLIGQTTA